MAPKRAREEARPSTRGNPATTDIPSTSANPQGTPITPRAVAVTPNEVLAKLFCHAYILAKPEFRIID